MRQLIARKSENQSLFYAYPVVDQQRSMIPVCYTQVTLQIDPQGKGLRMRREGELLVNRRFLTESRDLTEAEVAEFARRIGTSDLSDTHLRDLLGDGAIGQDGMIFRADPDVMTQGLMPGGQTDYRSAAASRSACNPAEAERVIGLVRQYIAAGVTDVGLVTPFRAQRELLGRLQNAAAEDEPDESLRAALMQVEIGTIHTFQGGQHRLMLFSTVVAPGARDGTVRWFEENRNLLNVAISRARDLLAVVCHRATLVKAGGILQAIVAYADELAQSSRKLPPLPPGLRPERLGLLPSEGGNPAKLTQSAGGGSRGAELGGAGALP